MIDEISITPTGFSQIYDEANDIWVNREFADPRSNYTNKTIECPDTHEISIHLPSVGNTISEVWDLVYGKGDKNNNNQRKTNIAWNQSSNDRTRLIHETNNGGYTHSKDEMATIAGAINTAQDLMGRIIIEDINDLSTIDSFDNFVDSDENPISKSSYIENNLNPDNIYYLSQDEKYYKVVSDYDFENIDSSKIIGNETDYYNLVRGYTSVDLMDPNNLDSNYYYLDTLNNEYVYNKNYLKNMSYWTLTATQVDFQINSFFVLNVGDDKSLFLSSEYEDGRYYDFKTSGPYSDILTNKYMFIPGEFYTYDSTTNRFIPAQKFIPVNTYYLPYTSNILSEDPLTNETIYGTVKFVQVYTPSGLDVNEIGTIVVREESSLDLEWFAEFPAYNPDAYICACFIKSTDLNKIPTYLNDKVSYYDAETKTSGDPHVKYHYINSLPEANLTYSVKPTVASGTTAQDGSALVAQQGDNIVCAILQIKFISEDYLSEGSYQPNTYYYKENSGYENIYNYKLETNARYDKEKTYYELQASRIYPLVYEKGIYYEKINDNNYILSTGDYSSSADYYEHNTYYVTNNHRSHTVGEIWDANIPWSEPLTDGSGQQLYEEVTTITNNNPQSDGLYEKNGNNFILTADTSIIELYEQINLTSSSYQTNTYYILETDRYSLSSNNFNANETYYKLVDIYKPIVLTENSYQTNTYYIINDQNEYEITTDPFSEEQQYYKYIGQEYQEIILTSSDYTTNTYYVLLPDRYVLSSGNFSNTQTYYEKVNKKYYKPIINDYSSIIINSQLVSKNDLKLVYDLQELNSFGRQYNTVNGLILKLNQLIGEQTASDRNLSTIYGTLRRLNDEINRLSLYKTSTINDIVTAINACYDESVEITDQLIDLRNQALGVYGGLLTEDEANYYYTSNSDISTILGFDLKNNSQRKKQDILYLYDSDNMVLGTENGQYESFVSVLGTTYYKMHDSSSPSGFKQGYLSQNIGFEEINLTAETYEENKYYIISNSKVFVKANGAFDINKTYYQISSDITDNNGQFIPQPETEFGIRTKSNFTTMPQLFKNSSALITAPRSVLNEIDHKVNIEAYQADIGKIPQGMSMTPENVVLGEEPENTENHVYPKGSILYRIEDLEQAAKDIEEVLYGNGLGDSTFNLNGNWIIGDAPLGYVTLDIPLNFYCNDNKNIMYTHLTVTNDIVKYSNETTGDTATVYRNSQWTDPAYQKITIGEVSSGEVSSETETTTSETENNSKSNDYTAVKVTDNLYIWLTNKASYCGKVANVWTVIPTGVEANPNSGSIFKPGSAAIEELKKHNPQGILARLTALDTDINSLPSTADYSEALKNSLTEIKQSVQLELTGSTASSDTGVAASKGLTALTVDSKYGFSLLQAKTSIYKYNAATGETTYDYNIRIAFRPPAALAAFEAPFLQVDGMQLFEGAQKLNIIGDASTNPNLDAEIGIDGKIYFRSSKTWSPVTGASAYTFLLSGHLVEITKDDKVEQNRITFSPPTGTVQKMCNFKTSVAVSWTPENPAFTVPASPTLANHTFIGWMSSDSKVLITPSDLGGGRDLTPVHAKWKDVFKEDGSGLKCSSTFYPVFRPANKLRFISINGTTYWVDPTTTTIYKFIQSYAKSQLVLFYVATKKDKKGNPTQVRDCLTLRSYLKSKKKNKKTVYYINANTYHYKYWAAKKKGAQSGYYGQTLQTIFSKKTEGQFANYKLDYYIAGAPANKLNTKKIDPVYLII